MPPRAQPSGLAVQDGVADPPTVSDLFLGFLKLGLIGFGGVLPMARDMLVVRRRWLAPDEFTELLGLCQFLPGGNVINLSVAVGMKFRGAGGALAALVGLIAAPSLVVIALGSIYARYSGDPHVRHLFTGLAGAAAGLLVAMAIKVALPLRGRPVAIAVALLCVLAIAVLRLPLLPTMLVLAPLSILATWAVGAVTGALVALALVFGQLSLLAFGGGNTILPEMQRQVVEVHRWMSASEFGALYALAQAAPGPNMMVVTLIGWHVAGWPGMIVTTVATFAPASILAGLVVGLWERFKDRPWRRVVQAGLVSVTVGLVVSGAAVITLAIARGWLPGLIAAASALVLVTTRAHPLAVLAAGGAAGLALGGLMPG